MSDQKKAKKKKTVQKKGKKKVGKSKTQKTKSLISLEGISEVAAAPVAVGRVAASLPPSISSAGTVTTFKRSEYVKDIKGNTNFGVSSFPINPSNSALFPWLSSMANGFTQFCFKKLVFRLVTTTTTGGIGNWILSALWDALEVIFTSKADMLNYGNAKEGNAWKDVTYVCDKKAMQYFNKYFNYINGGVPAGADPKTYNVGVINVASSGNSDTKVLGELHVDYEVDMMTPNTQGLTMPVGYGYWVHSGTDPSFALLTPAVNNRNILLEGKDYRNFTLVFTNYGQGQEYLILYSLFVSTYTSGQVALSGATITGASIVAADVGGGTADSVDIVDSSAGATPVMGCFSYMYIVPHQAEVTFTNISFTFAGTVSKTVLQVTPITPDSLAYYPRQFGIEYSYGDDDKLDYLLPHPRRIPVTRKAHTGDFVLPSSLEAKADDPMLAHKLKGNRISVLDPRHALLDQKFRRDAPYFESDWKFYVDNKDDPNVGFRDGDDPSKFTLVRGKDGEPRRYRKVETGGGVALLADPTGDLIVRVSEDCDDSDSEVIKPPTRSKKSDSKK